MAEDTRRTPSPSRGGPRFWGRRLASILYYAAAAAIAGTATIQITQQVFFPETPDAPPPFRTCDEAARALYDAIERGRVAASCRAENDRVDPEAALQRYRDEVRPVWAHRPAVDALCGAQHSGLLDALERLRYSEEHGVRHQAVELTALRHRVRALVEAIAVPEPLPKSDVTP